MHRIFIAIPHMYVRKSLEMHRIIHSNPPYVREKVKDKKKLLTDPKDILYSKTCLNRTPLGLKNLFNLDRCLVYTGSNNIDN